MKIIGILFSFLFLFGYSHSATITASGNGDWEDVNTWSPAQVPTDGDHIIIPNMITVSISSLTLIDLNGGPVTTITIQSGGTLFFNLASIIEFGANDIVNVETGGILHFEPLSGFIFPGFNTYPPIEDVFGPTTTTGPASIQNGALPIKLISFEVSIHGQEAIIVFKTSSEENFDYFSIERSANAKKYEVIRKVSGHGWSDRIIVYSFTDNNPLNGKAYYRLKAVDLDGTYEYFQTVMVSNEGAENSIRIVSNPVSDDPLQFQLNFVPTNEMSVEITDISGNQVFSGRFEPGLSKYIVDKQFEKGLYILKVSTGDKIYTSRFLKN